MSDVLNFLFRPDMITVGIFVVVVICIVIGAG